MIKTYFKTAIRHLFQNKAHSFINVFGLAIGMAVALLIGLWIVDECSCEKYNPGYDHIARVMQNQVLNGQTYTTRAVPIPLAAELRATFGSAFPQVVMSQWTQDHILAYGDKRLTQQGKFMEPAAPDLLGLKMLQGTKAGLQNPASILLSAAAAREIFGTADPMGRVMTIDNQMTVKVTGVYEDLPSNSQFHTALFIAPWDLYAAVNPSVKDVRNNWAYDAVEIFVRLSDKTDPGKLSAAIRSISMAHQKDKLAADYKPELFLLPMSRWHLYSSFKNGISAGGLIQFVWLFGIIGLFVLLLACINFMNLSTARSERRAREVGIRKAIGSLRGQLIGQFLSESVLTAVIAFVFSVLLIGMALPFFNRLADKNISIGWSAPWFWLAGLAFSIFTGLLAGSYPAFYLSSFRPVKVLKGAFRAGPQAAIPRKALVILQFTVSVILIIGTVVVLRQVQYAKDRPAGYDRTGLLSLSMNTSEFFDHGRPLRQELLRTGAVAEVAEATGMLNLTGFEWPGKNPGLQGEFGVVSVTYGFGSSVGWQFKEGRDFSRDFATDSSGIVINEAAVAFMGLHDPVGQQVTWDGTKYRIIGVIRNMIMESPYEPVRQTVYYLGDKAYAPNLFVKLNPNMPTGEALKKVQAVFHRIIPSAPFDYKFADAEYDKKFATEQRIGQLAGFFALFAIFISCMGIFGMASFMAEQRTKEIGIRKVLGASVFTIWRLLSKEFVILVGISIGIAGPVAYWFLHQWLQGYTYHSGIPWWVFAATGLGTLLITLLTVSVQSLKAAMANPINSLKAE